jgi:hypothetical protein
MVSRELAALVNKRFSKAPEARAYIDRLTTLSHELTSG